MRKSLIFLFAVLAFGACAPKVDIIQTGPWYVSRKGDWKKIKVFSSRKEIKKEWIAIALFHGKKAPYSNRNKIRKEIKAVKKSAARIGADAVLLVEVSDSMGKNAPFGAERLVYISGIAVKYVESANDKKSPAK